MEDEEEEAGTSSPQSLLSCQVSVPIREHWFPVIYSTVCAFTFVFDTGASHNGPCFGGYDYIRKPVRILICVDAKGSPLFKLIHNRVAKCWFHTLIFNGNYQTVHWARHSGVITSSDEGDTETANSANMSGCGDLTFPFCNVFSEFWRADLKLYFGISISVTFPALNSAVKNYSIGKQ